MRKDDEIEKHGLAADEQYSSKVILRRAGQLRTSTKAREHFE